VISGGKYITDTLYSVSAVGTRYPRTALLFIEERIMLPENIKYLQDHPEIMNEWQTIIKNSKQRREALQLIVDECEAELFEQNKARARNEIM